MATNLTNFWLKFFKDCGITNSTSTAVYATTFAENEIQKDMIIDLTREILRELGITMMGHVLAILKHAKAVHNQTLNEKIIANTNPVVETRPSAEIARIPVNISPMTRIIEHYVKNSENEASPSPVMRLASSPSRVAPLKLADRLGDAALKASASLKVTDRLGILKPAAATKRKPNVITLKPKQLTEDVPVKRIRKVLPEEEGGYKITMPRGITPRTKQILAKQNASQTAKTKTVFQRLGESSVSSTTCVDEPKVTFLGMGTTPSTGSGASKGGGPSVFLRLGGKNKTEISSTVVSESQETDESIGYYGVLKKDNGVKRNQLNTKLKTRLGEQSKTISIIKIEKDDDDESIGQTIQSTFRTQKVAFNPSALSRLGSVKETAPSEPETRVVKKKFIKTLANGKRVIVMRDVVEEVPAASQQPKATKKAVSFGESSFRSDNISKKAAITSRLGDEEDEEEQWDY